MSYNRNYRQPRNYRRPRQQSRRTKFKRGVKRAAKSGRGWFILCLPVIIFICAKIIAAWEAGLVK